MDYEDAGYEEADIVKVSILFNGKPADALSFLIHRNQAVDAGRTIVEKLKKLIDRQLFQIAIQASIGNKVRKHNLGVLCEG